MSSPSLSALRISATEKPGWATAERISFSRLMTVPIAAGRRSAASIGTTTAPWRGCPPRRLRAAHLSQLSGEDEAARRCEESREYRPLPGCGGRADRWREASPWGMPSRSPGRGPPYWKSRVLRRQALGDENREGLAPQTPLGRQRPAALAGGWERAARPPRPRAVMRMDWKTALVSPNADLRPQPMWTPPRAWRVPGALDPRE